MTCIVPTYPPMLLPGGSGAYALIEIANPVRGKKWVDAALLCNYINGHGGTLIAANSAGGSDLDLLAPNNTYTYRFYIWPRYQALARLWMIVIGPSDFDGGYGNAEGSFSADGTGLGYWFVTGGAKTPSIFWYWQDISQSDTATDVYCDILASSANKRYVYIQQIACYEVPRYLLEDDSNDLGVEQDTCKANSIIYDAVSNKSIRGPTISIVSSEEAMVSRRCGIFHFAKSDGVTITTVSYASLFLVDPECLGRKIYLEDSAAGAVSGRMIEWYAYVHCDSDIEDALRVTTASGNVSTINASNCATACWIGPGTFYVDCEDLTDEYGLRDDTWETLHFEAKKGENTLTIYAISVGEPTGELV